MIQWQKRAQSSPDSISKIEVHVVFIPLSLHLSSCSAFRCGGWIERWEGERRWMSVFFLGGGGGMSWQAPAYWGIDCHICSRQWKNFTTSLKAPQTIFRNSPDLFMNLLDTIWKRCQSHLSLCSQSGGCKCPSVSRRTSKHEALFASKSLKCPKYRSCLHTGCVGAHQFSRLHRFLLLCMTRAGTICCHDKT